MTRVLERLIVERGSPENVRSDNGPEVHFAQDAGLAEEWKIGLVHIQPDRPMQNGHVESFHGWLRDECLNACWFRTLNDVRSTLALWREDYNFERHCRMFYEFEAVEASLSGHRSVMQEGEPDILTEVEVSSDPVSVDRVGHVARVTDCMKWVKLVHAGLAVAETEVARFV